MPDPEVEVKIFIPLSLFEAIKRDIAGSSYTSIEEYIKSLLFDTVKGSETYSEEEEKSIRKRLASLGYE